MVELEAEFHVKYAPDDGGEVEARRVVFDC